MLIDVHAHLADSCFQNDLAEVIKGSKEEGLKTIISNGVSQDTNRLTLEIAKKFEIVKPALGLHPLLLKDLSSSQIDEEIAFIEKKKPFAIGEIGLDFSRDVDAKKQKEAFGKFLVLAEKLDVPIIVHSRKAEKEVFEILQTTKLKKVVMHCFTGKLKLAKSMLDVGFSFSIPPIVTYATQFQELIREANLTSLLTESDAPLLGPKKGERNEPKFVKFAIDKIAAIKNLDKNEAQKIIFMNFQKMFTQK